nr:keratin, type I cytoskeletal 10-like [Arachis hypogaea]
MVIEWQWVEGGVGVRVGIGVGAGAGGVGGGVAPPIYHQHEEATGMPLDESSYRIYRWSISRGSTTTGLGWMSHWLVHLSSVGILRRIPSTFHGGDDSGRDEDDGGAGCGSRGGDDNGGGVGGGGADGGGDGGGIYGGGEGEGGFQGGALGLRDGGGFGGDMGFGDYFVGVLSSDMALHESQKFMSPGELLSDLLDSDGLDRPLDKTFALGGTPPSAVVAATPERVGPSRPPGPTGDEDEVPLA